MEEEDIDESIELRTKALNWAWERKKRMNIIYFLFKKIIKNNNYKSGINILENP